MPLGHFDLTGKWAIRQGFAYSIRFTFPATISLAGYSAVAQMRRGPGAAGPPYFDVEPTVGQDDDDLWYVQLDLTDDEAGAIPSTHSGEWELALTNGGSTDLGFEGTADCEPKVIA